MTSFAVDSPIGISGIGLVTPAGTTREATWERVLSGVSTARWLDDEPGFTDQDWPAHWRPAGCPVPQFLPPTADQPLTSPLLGWLAAATDEACRQAGLDLSTISPERIAVVMGTSKGDLDAYSAVPVLSGPRSTSHIPWWWNWPSGPAGWLAARLGVYGPVLAPVAACATGLVSVLRGIQLLRDDLADVVLAGSVEGPLSPLVWSSYRRLGILARVGEESPAQAGKPFDQRRTGFHYGCGAGVLILERQTAVRARGQQLLASCVGGGMLSDATGLTQVSDDARGLTRLVTDVLHRADWLPGEVDYINLHGTGTRDNDRYESQGLLRALGSAAEVIPCSSSKGTLGHLLGAASAVELGLTVLALRDQLLPPTANWEQRDPDCPLDYVPRTARPARVHTALKLALGFGGHLAALALRHPTA